METTKSFLTRFLVFFASTLFLLSCGEDKEVTIKIKDKKPKISELQLTEATIKMKKQLLSEKERRKARGYSQSEKWHANRAKEIEEYKAEIEELEKKKKELSK